MHFLIEDSDPHTGPGTRDREETDGARPLEGQQRTDDILRAGQHRRGKHNRFADPPRTCSLEAGPAAEGVAVTSGKVV